MCNSFGGLVDGLDPIEGSFVLQGLRQKQGTHAFSSRFQLLLERKLQAELAAKEQQNLAVELQSGINLEQSQSNPFVIGGALEQGARHPPGHELSASDSNVNFLHPYPLGLLKQPEDTRPFAVHDNMPGQLRNDIDTLRHLNSTSSHYSDLSSSDAYASPSIVPPNILPPAVQTSYLPAPSRSQHYQRLLAVKLANSGQTTGHETTTTNDAAASFMQNWGEHSLDPNYPTPQEMSFLPSSQSPLYQLFTSGHTQDQWQDGTSFQESALRPTAGAMTTQSFTATASTSHFDISGHNTRHIWPQAQLQRSDVSGPTNIAAPPYLSITEPVHKYVPWMNPYAQAVEDGDVPDMTTPTSGQSSRAPAGHHLVSGQEIQQQQQQQSENTMYRDHVHAGATAPTALSASQPVKHEANDVQSSMSLGEENAQSPGQTANTTVTDDGGEDGDEPKKAVLACHFCRGRKLKYVTHSFFDIHRNWLTPPFSLLLFRCDGTRPSCAHCDKRGLACSYDEKIRRRGPGKRKREQMAILAAAEGQMDEDGTPLLHKLLAPKVKGKRGRKPKNKAAGEDGVDASGGGEVGDLSNMSTVHKAHAAGSSASSATTMDVPYTRPPNPYLPSYFIPSDHHQQQQQQQQQQHQQQQHVPTTSSAEFGMHGHGHGHQQGRDEHDHQQRRHVPSLLHHPSQSQHHPSVHGYGHVHGHSNGIGHQDHPHLDPKLSHIPAVLPPHSSTLPITTGSPYAHHPQTYVPPPSYHPASSWPEDMDVGNGSAGAAKRQRVEYHHQNIHGGW
ncbi:hypothetical protein QFC24_000786 [Naganishia onofrii]|uniref:Uncharacterized protein n=1 Tax=Naganishia onofrii TaxID=1851511 RepID=A0ACC2XVK6_9TREE|nr:hypothetical protein QFC24_000786 [Naganishia onofrii]